MLDRSPPLPSQWRACPMVFGGNKSGAGNRLRLRLVVFPGNLACAPPGYPALGPLNGLHPFRGAFPVPWAAPFCFPGPLFLPPASRSCVSPCSSIESAPKLLPSCPRHGPRRIHSFSSSSPTTIAATPFPRHTTHFPSFGSPSQVDLDRPPPLLRQLGDSNIHSSTDTAT